LSSFILSHRQLSLATGIILATAYVFLPLQYVVMGAYHFYSAIESLSLYAPMRQLRARVVSSTLRHRHSGIIVHRRPDIHPPHLTDHIDHRSTLLYAKTTYGTDRKHPDEQHVNRLLLAPFAFNTYKTRFLYLTVSIVHLRRIDNFNLSHDQQPAHIARARAYDDTTLLKPFLERTSFDKPTYKRDVLHTAYASCWLPLKPPRELVVAMTSHTSCWLPQTS
jgi:hypothetical protein